MLLATRDFTDSENVTRLRAFCVLMSLRVRIVHELVALALALFVYRVKLFGLAFVIDLASALLWPCDFFPVGHFASLVCWICEFLLFPKPTLL